MFPQNPMNSQEKEEEKMASWNPKIANVPPKPNELTRKKKKEKWQVETLK
jgi:hypothetical protein